MGRVNTPTLSEADKVQLAQRSRSATSRAVRMRCHPVLLKAEGRHSKELASIVKMCGMSVNNWLNRYKTNGIEGLVTKPRRGRKKL